MLRITKVISLRFISLPNSSPLCSELSIKRTIASFANGLERSYSGVRSKRCDYFQNNCLEKFNFERFSYNKILLKTYGECEKFERLYSTLVWPMSKKSKSREKNKEDCTKSQKVLKKKKKKTTKNSLEYHYKPRKHKKKSKSENKRKRRLSRDSDSSVEVLREVKRRKKTLSKDIVGAESELKKNKRRKKTMSKDIIGIESELRIMFNSKSSGSDRRQGGTNGRKDKDVNKYYSTSSGSFHFPEKIVSDSVPTHGKETNNEEDIQIIDDLTLKLSKSATTSSGIREEESVQDKKGASKPERCKLNDDNDLGDVCWFKETDDVGVDGEKKTKCDEKESDHNQPTNKLKEKDKLLLEKLKQLRPNEYTIRGQGFVQEPWHPKEQKFQFRVVSYNVLSQTLLETNKFLYRNHNPFYLNWTYRGPLLMKELQTINADILCLQEVEASYKEPFFDQLEDYGYKGVYKKRTGDKVDGCAIYYKESKFSMDEFTTVEFNQPGVSILDRDNIGLIVKLHPVGWPKHKLVVATTHLLYNPRRHDIRLAQMQVMLAEIERFAYNSKYSNFTYYPMILAGDFNLQPYTAIYHLLLGGSLQYDELDKKLFKYEGPNPRLGKILLPPYLGINDKCQHTEVVQIRDGGFGMMTKTQEKVLGIYNSEKPYPPRICEVCEKDTKNFGTGVLVHNFGFESVYYHQDDDTKEPEATTNHNEWITVDYLVYTPQIDKKYQHHQLQLVNRSRLPTARECEQFIKHIPNSVCPSDHLPLVASFFLRLRPGST